MLNSKPWFEPNNNWFMGRHAACSHLNIIFNDCTMNCCYNKFYTALFLLSSPDLMRVNKLYAALFFSRHLRPVMMKRNASGLLFNFWRVKPAVYPYYFPRARYWTAQACSVLLCMLCI
ncbi:MAG: hypothetical protein KDK05_26085, partial [Candidatus Competibacteraceae bacterium]|nr:hypothetical protein [Candidatus Competibacteraceae bacterium]